VRFRKLVPFFLLAALCLAQGTWQTATDLPGVDWTGVTAPRKQAALKFMRDETCSCGCNMKIAECRVTDPSCAVSRKLSGVVVKDFSAGKNAEFIRAELKKIAAEPPPLLDEAVSISTAGDPYKGPANARMTMVEYSDFQCPFCSKAVAQANAVLKIFPKDVKLVFKQFPLDSHADAEFGAEAALAAQAQGKFWEMHDLLFEHQANLKDATLLKLAVQLRLSSDHLKHALAEGTYAPRVKTDLDSGIASGVQGTPTFYINGQRHDGSYDFESMVEAIESHVKLKTAL